MTASFQNNNFLKTLISLGIIILFALIFTQNRDGLGDVNSDGSVDVQDVVLMVDIILNDGAGYSDDQLWAGDVNEDSATDISDIVIIVDWILNPPEATECPEYYSPCEDDTTQCCPMVTSHEFEWFMDTLGVYASFLYDVSIVDENDVWAVGQIRTNEPDTLHNLDYTVYNAAHWDGEKWDLIRIIPQPPYNDFYAPYFSTFTFNEEDVWVGVNRPLSFDGSEWTAYYAEDGWSPMGWINAIWGSSSDNMYFAGYNGDIAHYNGETFTLMETGTDYRLRDIHGSEDGSEVFVVGWGVAGGNIVLRLVNDQWEEFYQTVFYFPSGDEGNYGHVRAVSVLGDTAYFSTKAGLWKYCLTDSTSTLIPNETTLTEGSDFNEIIVNSPNDILLISVTFTFVHFNGVNWTLNEQVHDIYGDFNIYSNGSDFKRSFSVTVGYIYSLSHAIVARGYRVE